MEKSFELKDYKKCFKKFKEQLTEGKKVELVLSTDFYTQGYWIEPEGSEVGDDDFIYSPDEAFKLEERIDAELSKVTKGETYRGGIIF